MSRKLCIASVLMVLVLVLVGCTKEEKLNYSYDYNKKILISNDKVWTPKGIYYIGSKYSVLHYISPNGKNTILCSKPECKHNNFNCEAYISTDELFFYQNKLCYMNIDPDNHKTDIYTMNWKGKERKKFFTVEFPDDFKKQRRKGGNEYRFSLLVNGNMYLQEMIFMTEKEEIRKIYLTNLDEPSKIETIDPKGMGALIYRFEGDWIISLDIVSREPYQESLLGYNIKTKERRVLVNAADSTLKDAGIIGDVRINNDDLIWYEHGAGFYRKNIKKDLDPDQKELFIALKDGERLANGCMGKDYLMLCNMKFPLNPISEEKEGISLYNYSGKLIQFLSTKNQCFQYCMESEDKIYFTDFTKSPLIPDSYLKKASIQEGKAKMIQISQTMPDGEE